MINLNDMPSRLYKVLDVLSTIILTFICSILVYGIFLLILGSDDMCRFRCFSILFTVFGTLWARARIEIRKLKKNKNYEN